MLDQRNYETILIDKRPNGVARATLNRPERLNAVDGRMNYELTRLWVDANADAAVKVLLVTGQGRAFCSGGDFGGNNKPGPGGPGATMREARHVIPGPNHHVRMSSRPASQRSNGGIDWVASSWIRAVSALMSYASNAAT